MQRQSRAAGDLVGSRAECDCAARELDDDARVSRSVDRVRIVTRTTRETLGATGDCARCNLNRAAPVRKSDRMSHRILVDPERVRNGRDRLYGWHWAGRGQGDRHPGERRAGRGEGEESQHPDERELRDQPPAAHHDSLTVAPPPLTHPHRSGVVCSSFEGAGYRRDIRERTVSWPTPSSRSPR